MPNSISDNELITKFVEEKDEKAFETLLRRHYDTLYKRLLSRCHNPDDAKDLSQQLWIRVIDNLGTYSNSDRFPNFLNTIATNLLNDHWRRAGVKQKVFIESNEDQTLPNQIPESSQTDASLTLANDEAVAHLINQLIPALPCEIRIVYLLRHESEHWDSRKRLQWHHLAELNGTDVATIWSNFEQARGKLVKHHHNPQQDSSLNCDEQLVFLIWSQAQRPAKDENFTEAYFAELLNIPVNTFKTRYRTAVKHLSEGLQDWR